MFAERFMGSAVHGADRTHLSFDARLTRVNTIRNEWSFVLDTALRHNIAYALQDVHFGVLLVNDYNVYLTPEAMIFKHAIVQCASVAEAVLQYDLKLVEDDPRLQEILGREWVWVDMREIPLPDIEVPDGQRVVSGTQRAVPKERLDHNAKMHLLIRAARKLEMIDEDMAKELDLLRKLRNNIHIKLLDEPEYTRWTAQMANDALDLLERFRWAMLAWTRNHRVGTEVAPNWERTLVTASPESDDFLFEDDDVPF